MAFPCHAAARNIYIGPGPPCLKCQVQRQHFPFRVWLPLPRCLPYLELETKWQPGLSCHCASLHLFSSLRDDFGLVCLPRSTGIPPYGEDSLGCHQSLGIQGFHLDLRREAEQAAKGREQFLKPQKRNSFRTGTRAEQNLTLN